MLELLCVASYRGVLSLFVAQGLPASPVDFAVLVTFRLDLEQSVSVHLTEARI